MTMEKSSSVEQIIIIFHLCTVHSTNAYIDLGVSRTAICVNRRNRYQSMSLHPVDLKTTLWENLTDLNLTAQCVVYSELHT
uniref:Uncharacterized protein n=1 Tax=Arion vulgaris TaxID=1028688 RepID=A0A0B7AJ39_9EUPU